MPKITYVEPGGQAHVVDVTAGSSVMQGAVLNGVPGIDADCGGACVCSTCHVVVDRSWLQKLPAIDDDEDATLELVDDREDNSRLSCQLTVDEHLDGLIVHLPESQG